ncbi:acyltransferase family protein [Flavobacterium sp. MR2016-29]|uniref:acyltransferase family protein n=1 Tax=Flavobacterium sp. MR2016-29 TaxID=2783795 RepID=UPI00188D1632|nr:acyltransferase family protein [Flavobacterium sp. MR2016-29]MBF4492135.1 acyltransferase family protein [Flavobacterium sp. MR2016-29]
MINSKNFDNIRTVALVFILLIHTSLSNIGLVDFTLKMTDNSFHENFNQLVMHALYNNLFKPGTILFFIISGFLFEMQFSKFNNFSTFIKKKAKSLLFPYLIIFVIPTIIITGLVEPNIGMKENLTISIFAVRIFKNIFLTNYWFVPALFVTLIINYFIKTKYLFKSLIIFIPIWIIAYLNIYLKFAITSHTVWFIGFFFIFTLGRLMYIYNEKISNLSIVNNYKKLILLSVVSYIISNLESIFIMTYGNYDFVNTLKIGNILYSFSLFYLLNTLLNKTNFIIPIDISFYFIYLIHPFVLRMTWVILFKNNSIIFEYPSQYLYNIVHFLIVLITSFAIQQIFFKLSFKSKTMSGYVFKK